ncbi:Phosphomevalonate kinase [uncultured archaeon]|nr:Phosphomevalonate kinase [uncultured archaeon]
MDARYENGALTWTTTVTPEVTKKMLVAHHAIETTLRYLEAKGVSPAPFAVETENKDTLINLPGGGTTKVGFGSSAAATAGLVAAILSHAGDDLSLREAKDRVFKISTLAHYLAQGKVGSAFDIAAATYGGTLIYERFDPEWLIKETNAKPLPQVIDEKWPSFTAEHLKMPEGFTLLAAFSGVSASTTEFVKKVSELKKTNPMEYNLIYGAIADITHHFIAAAKEGDTEETLSLLCENRKLLLQLQRSSGVTLEIPQLTNIIETANKAGAAAKFSGAGGGDCAIAVTYDHKVASEVKKKWAEAGIPEIPVKIPEKGAAG